jgi:FLVCR family feline leukemia virus subgroup C receptor-related protein
LFVFCSITLLNAFNWIEYSIIQDVVVVFYNQSLPQDKEAQTDATNWFSMVYMLAYIPLVFPAMFLLDRKGLRLSCILGALLTAIGAILKCAAVRPDLFAVAMLAQTICGIAQSFTLGIPARLSALWFGPTEIATATSVNILLNYSKRFKTQV